MTAILENKLPYHRAVTQGHSLALSLLLLSYSFQGQSGGFPQSRLLEKEGADMGHFELGLEVIHSTST